MIAGKVPARIYTCPTCKAQFSGPGAAENGIKGKRCPAGHFSSMAKLRLFERTGRVSEPKHRNADPDVAARAAKAGLRTKAELLQMIAVGMLDGYERAMATLPPGVAMMVSGAFGKFPAIAREALK